MARAADDSVPADRGMGSDFSADTFPWRIWDLHLAAREIKCLGVSVGRELAVCHAPIYGTDRVCLYWLASLHGALAHTWQINVCERGRGHAESVVPDILCDWRARVFVSSRGGHLEFSVQMGLAATVKAQQAAGRLGALVGVAFSVVGILIIISFRYDWHPFSVYLPNK